MSFSFQSLAECSDKDNDGEERDIEILRSKKKTAKQKKGQEAEGGDETSQQQKREEQHREKV